MKFFYDGQIRRYLSQMIRMLSGFKYQTGDGKQITIPVQYGDLTRQVAHIIRDNSSNKIPSAPRIALYITDLQLDRNRLSDASFISKVHIRERDFNPVTQQYTTVQGKNYTVERLMPTPYNLTVKADIWSTNNDQKLQILEQILVLFNPSMELQTTDNYIDWTSLTRVELTDMIFSSRSIPMGNESEIDIATLTFETPIYISPPAKVKKLGVITDIIMNIYGEGQGALSEKDLYGDLYYFPDGAPDSQLRVNIGGFGILVLDNTIRILEQNTPVINPFDGQPIPTGDKFDWRIILDQYPGKFIAGSSRVFLQQEDSTEVVGTLAEHPLDPSLLTVNWDPDSFHTNTAINSGYYPGGRGTFDAIINPESFNPGTPVAGTRYLLVGDIGDQGNTDGAESWKNLDASDFVASVNDIVEWNGSSWSIVFDATNITDVSYQTNLRTNIQYKWDGHQWSKAFEGIYRAGYWRLVL